VEQRAKFSLVFFASYSGKFNFLILFKFDTETSFKPKVLFTVLSSRMDYFHFHGAGSTFETTFLPNTRVWDLWGIWSVDLSRMHRKVAVACTIWALGLSKPKLPRFYVGLLSAAYPT
jgi:hypothetical protein